MRVPALFSSSRPLLLAAVFVSGGIAGACADDAPGGGCPTGKEGCLCTDAGECKGEGLSCISGLCVVRPPSTCGDGILDEGEECDAGSLNAATGACKSDCTIQFCGDGVVGPGELCDDGNTSDADNCNANCSVPTCGNGRVEAAEACDDGNEQDADACTNRCVPASCGDGIVYTEGGEACDDGNGTAGDGCSPSCTIEPFCGDDVALPGELCWSAPQPLLGGQAPSGIALADFNADGHLDIAVVSADQAEFKLFVGDGEGRFEGSAPYDTLGTDAGGIAAGDFDGDGLADVAVTNRVEGEVVIYWGSGSPSADGAVADPEVYADAALAGAGQLIAADFDPNGDKDELLVATSSGVALVVVDGTAQRGAPIISGFSLGGTPDTSVAAIDIDGDGFPQAVVADASTDTLQRVNYLASPKTLAGTGNPAAESLSQISAPRGLMVADFDEDGSEDLVVGAWDPVACDYPTDADACTPEAFGVSFGDGQSSLGAPQTRMSGKAPIAFAAGDVDDDGDPDLIVVNRFSDTLEILTGDGNGNFAAGLELATVGHQPIDVAIGLLDDDEVVDIVALDNYTNTISLFLSRP